MSKCHNCGIEVAYTPMTDDEFLKIFDERETFPDYVLAQSIEQAVLARLGVAPTLDQAKRICEEAGLAVVPKQDSAVFTEWLCREMPVGTIIGGAEWWAERIIKRFIPQAKLEAARGVE